MEKLTVTLLGAFGATLGAQAVPFNSDRLRGLLAYLLIEARPHRREALSGLFWPDAAPEKAAANLRVSLSRLRQSLAPFISALPENSFFDVNRSTVEIHRRESCFVDAVQFDALIAQVAMHAHEDVKRCSVCARRLEEAALLYRGDFLAGLNLPASAAFDDWQQREQERRHQRALEALDILVEHKIALSSWAEAQRYSEQQLELEPWREESYRRLMAIRLELGDRGGALAIYERCLEVLANELGATPALETEALYRRIRALAEQDQSVDYGIAPALPPHNLPAQRLPFFGREDELRHLAALLIDPASRLVTLTGIGGAGKTRLALAVSRRVLHNFPDGSWFVSLAAIDGANPAAATEVWQAIAAAIGYTFSGLRSAQEQVLAYLAQKRMLLLLDNFEQLTGVSDLLLALLEATTNLTLLVTSRQRLLFHEEHAWLVDKLDLPPEGASDISPYSAVQLFAARAAQYGGHFQLDPANAASVAQVCRLVSGIPLAIELAASWSADMEVAQIASAIARTTDFLQSNMRGLPARHNSIRAVFDGSWGLLAQPEQQAWARLSVFRGSFSLAAAADVAGLDEQQLISLARKSLVVRRDGGRFELHELLREYAAEKLAALADAATALAATHSHYYLTRLEQAKPELGSPKAKETLGQLQPDRANFSLAWDWAAQHDRWDIIQMAVVPFSFYLWVQALYHEALLIISTTRQRAAAAHDVADENSRRLAEAALYFEEALFLLMMGRNDESIDRGQRGIALLREGDPPGVWVRGLHNLAGGYRRQGRYVEAAEVGTRTVTVARAANMRSPLASALSDLAWVYGELGDFPAALAALDEAIELYRQEDNLRGQSVAGISRGMLARRMGDYRASHQHFTQTLQIAEQIGSRDAQKAAIGNLALIYEIMGQYSRALQFLGRCLAFAQQDSDRWTEIVSHSSIGRVYLRCGDYVTAQAEFLAALALAEETATRHSQSTARQQLAWLMRWRGDYAAALPEAEQALRIAYELKDRDNIGCSLLELGLIKLAGADAAGAIPLLLDLVALRQELRQVALLAEARAALAEAYLASGATAQAQELIAQVLPVLPDDGTIGANDRLRVYWGCYQVLAATGDESGAHEVLLAAGAVVSAEAAQIEDANLRESYLNIAPLPHQISQLLSVAQ